MLRYREISGKLIVYIRLDEGERKDGFYSNGNYVGPGYFYGGWSL